MGELGTVPNNSILQGAINAAPIKGVTTSAWNIRTGGLSKTVYKGTQDQITQIALDCQSKGYEYTITGGHVWTLEITYPVDIIVNSLSSEPDPVPIWEVSVQKRLQGLFELRDRPFIAALNASLKASIEEQLKNPTDTTLADLKLSDDDIRNVYTAYKLKAAGVEGKPLFMPTLKRTWVTSNKYSVATNSKYDLKLFNKTDLVNYINNNAKTTLAQLPQAIINMLPESQSEYDNNGTLLGNQIGYNNYTGDFSTFVGYLQMPASVQTLSLNKVQWSQEWIFNKWSAGIWGLYDTFNNQAAQRPDPALMTTT